LRSLTRIALIAVSIACGVPLWGAATKAPMAAKGTARASAPLLTEAQARAYVKQIAPLVEKAAGRKFKSPPRVKIVQPVKYGTVFTNYLVPQAYTAFPQYSNDQLGRVYAAFYDVLAKGQPAWYDRHAQVVCIAPSCTPFRLKAAGIYRSRAGDLAKIMLAHELTHALIDQETRQTWLAENVPYTAVAASGEGLAVFVEAKVADQLGIGDLVRKCLSRLGASWKDTDHPAGQMLRRMNLSLATDVYQKGRDFIAWHYAHGGIDHVWQVLLHPPAQTSMIYHPETYSPKVSGADDCRPALKAAQSCFSGYFEWMIADTGEMQLRALYWDMDTSLRDAVLADLERARVLCGYGGDHSIMYVTVFVFKKPDMIPKFVSGLDDLLRKRLEAGSAVAKVTDLSFKPFEGVESDNSSRASFTSEPGKGDFRNIFVRVARGRAMVEVFQQSTKDIDDRTIAKAIEAVFSKLPKDVPDHREQNIAAGGRNQVVQRVRAL